MHDRINRLCDEYNVTEKDRYDIVQIYSLLPVHNKRKLVDNFANFATKFAKIQSEIALEREVLIGEALKDIK